MAHRFVNEYGEKRIRFENGLWDSVWGYTCRKCGGGFGDIDSAEKHDTEQPCQEKGYKRVLWQVKIPL